MTDDKIYTPEIIEENPLPGGIEPIVYGENNTANTFTPTTSKANSLPQKRYANELLSSALNTRSKNVLQEFELQDSGGFKIGDYKDGITGDIRITPNGLTARSKAGLTTFALDGTTGDAVFAGTLQAGTLIGGSGSVIIEESNAGNGRILLYNNGIPSILIGDPNE
jgi:hypothetical protein